MKKTVGNVDRTVRVVLAIGALIGAGVAGFSSGWGIVLIIVAAVLAVTGSSGYCPLYSVTGLSTMPKGDESTSQRHGAHSH